MFEPNLNKNIYMQYSWENLSYEDKLKKYVECKDAYYNDVEIVSDIEFDALEKSIGLENKSFIGTESSTYTIEHPLIMGTLSKEQIKIIRNNIDWRSHFESIMSYINKSNCKSIIITPKYDGCSFEVSIVKRKIISISSRGNKKYGKDIYPFLVNLINKAINFSDKEFETFDEWCIRGEILIKKEVFLKKYSEFTNPRSWVSGLTNQKYNNLDKLQEEQIKDLSIVIYDIKRKNEQWEDINWNSKEISVINKEYLPEFFKIIELKSFNAEIFKDTYNDFSKYRQECQYALDGFVIKPLFDIRKSTNEERPKDCVAVKYLPYIKDTIVRSIEWNLGKTGELFPVVVFDPIELDNRIITRASASNYGNLVSKKINKGAEISVSLAGDIIPYIINVITESEDTEYVDNLNDKIIDGCHLYEKLSPFDISRNKFIASIRSININGLGDKIADRIFNSIGNSDIDNILQISSKTIREIIGGELGNKISIAYDKKIEKIQLNEIIQSCSFEYCGEKTSLECAKYLLNVKYDFSGLNYESYNWVMSKDSKNYEKLLEIMKCINKTFESFELNDEKDNKIPIIMTGKPILFSTKKEFLENNDNFIETTKWDECKILFTNDLNSNSSKMVKAKKLGIEIREY